MTVVTGLSGSGKSTLAFDLLFAEGQRRYLDSLNAYARQFVEQLERPDVDSITGIPPAVAIEQRVTRGGRKSTVATITEIFQFIRLLYAKLGQARDPETDEPAIRQTPAEILARLEKSAARGAELRMLAPLVKGRKGYHTEVAKVGGKKRITAGCSSTRNGSSRRKFKALDRYVEHTISVEVGRFGKKQSAAERRRLVETALALGPRHALRASMRRAAPPSTAPRFFVPAPAARSTNSSRGSSPSTPRTAGARPARVSAPSSTCAATRRPKPSARSRSSSRRNGPMTTSARSVPTCQGERINPLGRAVRLPLGEGAKSTGGRTIGDVGRLSIVEALRFFKTVKPAGREARIARDILPEIVQRLKFLVEVGLGYLSLDRSAATLSGGESQRIRLAAQLGSELQGVLYVLDEPTIGLHPRDNARLLESLGAPCAPRATRSSWSSMTRTPCASPIASSTSVPARARRAAPSSRKVRGTSSPRTPNRPPAASSAQPLRHPLRGERRLVDAANGLVQACAARARTISSAGRRRAAAGRFVALCGVSGAGKSTLLHDVIKPAAQAAVAARKKKRRAKPAEGPWKKLEGFEVFTSVYEVDQAPIGKTSRSTPATYIGFMDEIRGLFARLPLARQRGYEASRFSFNSGDGPLPRSAWARARARWR